MVDRLRCAHPALEAIFDDVYANAGLDRERALREAKANEHHKALLRSSCSGLMEFLNSCGLLTNASLPGVAGPGWVVPEGLAAPVWERSLLAVAVPG